MNIEITAAEVGMMICFVIAIVGIGMGIRLRAMRKVKKKVVQDVEEYEFKVDPETLAPQKVLKEKPVQSEPEQVPENPEQEKPKHDVDALLEDLKKDSEKE